MQAKITKSLLNQIKPGSTDVWLWDTTLSGFGLRITPKDARTFWVKYRMGGRECPTRKFKLGVYGVLTPEQARSKAEDILAKVRLGIDPAAEKQSAKQPKIGQTIKDAVELFMTRHASKLRTEKEIRRTFYVDILPIWAAKKTKEIRRADVVELLDTVVDSGRAIRANRIFALIRKFFNWCIERGIIETSPCNGVKAPSAETSRDRVLNEDELRMIWAAASEMLYPFGPWIKMLLLTGQRRDEVAGMRWSELNLEAGLWSLPKDRTKNARAHDVPLSGAVLTILNSLPRMGGAFVFSTSGNAPISGYSKAKASLERRIKAASGDAASWPQWQFHDFRRTVATELAKLGIAVHVVERLLNHVSGTIQGVAAVYNRHSYLDERRQAMEAWASRLDAIVSGAPANVVRLKTTRTRKTSI